MAGTQLVQRLSDKDHSWGDLRQLIPGILAQGLMGYAFTCPDMIGGGQWMAFSDESTLDRELIVRSAQVHALMPLMQLSVAPWRILTPEQNAICLKAAKLHQQFGPKLVELARQSAKTGEPIARSMRCNYPDADYGRTIDQFMLGTDILVAPVVQKGARSRSITFPQGNWVSDDDSIVVGPAVKTIAVPSTDCLTSTAAADGISHPTVSRVVSENGSIRNLLERIEKCFGGIEHVSR